jgi:glutamine amidotransferase
MIVAIIDYGSGNLRSAAKAFERAAADDSIAAEIIVTSAPEAVAGSASVSACN